MRLFSWDTVKKDIINEKIWRKAIYGEKITVAQFFIGKDAVVPKHQHESEQIAYVVEGVLKVTVDGQEVVVRKGDVIHIPSNAPHSAVALEDTIDIEIFSPIRTDWLTGTDSYFQKK